MPEPPARFAYADPPYLGLGAKFYGEHHEQAAEFDTVERHVALIDELAGYDGWAMHLHLPSLRTLLPLVPEDARLCAWVKPWARMHPGARLQWTWEPVLIRPVRAPIQSERDWISANATRERGLKGAKPEAVAQWVFAAAGLRPTDVLVDLFPGTGAITRAWDRWRTQQRLPLPATGRQQRRANLTLDMPTPARAGE